MRIKDESNIRISFFAPSLESKDCCKQRVGASNPFNGIPYGRVGTRAYNADNRRGVADVGLQLKVSP